MPLVTFAQQDIKGTVKGEDGNPIPGVKVEIQETFFKAITNAEGEFLFSKVKTGEYKLDFSSIGFMPQSQLVKIAQNDQELAIVLMLQKI